MFLSPSLSNGFGTGLLSSAFFPQRQRQMQSGEKGQRGGIWEGVGRVKEGKREASGQYTRTRANFKAKHPKGGEKERREQKLLGHNFFLFLFLFSSFFSGLERVAKHDFYGIVLQSGSVKSVKSVRQEQGEQGEQSREGEGGRGCLYVCACFCVFV